MHALADIFEAQLTAQDCTDEESLLAASEIRDGYLRKLTKRQRFQLFLACGVLKRLAAVKRQ